MTLKSLFCPSSIFLFYDWILSNLSRAHSRRATLFRNDCSLNGNWNKSSERQVQREAANYFPLDDNIPRRQFFKAKPPCADNSPCMGPVCFFRRNLQLLIIVIEITTYLLTSNSLFYKMRANREKSATNGI